MKATLNTLVALAVFGVGFAVVCYGWPELTNGVLLWSVQHTALGVAGALMLICTVWKTDQQKQSGPGVAGQRSAKYYTSEKSLSSL